MSQMIIRRGGALDRQVPYAVGRFAEADDSYIINQPVGAPPFGGFACSLASTYALDIAPDGSGRSWFAGSEVTLPDGLGKAWYIKDRDSGEIWSAFHGPVRRETDDYEVIYAPGRVSVYSLVDKIACTLTISPAPEASCELWLVHLENRSAKERSIEFTTYAEPFIGSPLEAKYLPRDRALALRAPLEAAEADRVSADMVFFHSATLTPTRFQTNRWDFVGDQRTLANPLHVQDESSVGSDAHVRHAAASLSVTVDLPIEGAAEFGFCFGVARTADHALKIVRSLGKTGDVTSAIQLARERWRELSSTVTVHTPDRAFDALVNTWLPYETYSEWLRDRSGSACLDPSRVADLLKGIYPFVASAPALCRDSLLSFTAGLSLLGAHAAETGSQVQLPAAELLWLPMTTAAYIAETGDEVVLDLGVELRSGPSLTLKQHCERAAKLCANAETPQPAAVLTQRILQQWGLILGEDAGIPAQARAGGRTEPPEQRSLPQRIAYFKSISPTLAQGGADLPISDYLAGAEDEPSSATVACSTYCALVEQVLGLAATVRGLTLHPSLPESWFECEVARRFRGDTYHVRIRRAASQRDRGVSVMLDGGPVLGSTLPYFGDGGEHAVEAVIG